MTAFQLRRALRHTTAKPSLAILIIAILGVGIGAATSVYSVVEAVFLRPVPFPNAERLANLVTPIRAGFNATGIAANTIETWRGQTHLFERIEAYAVSKGAARIGTDVVEVHLQRVTPGIMEMLGVRPKMGRVLTASDADGGALPIVVSERFWERRLGRNANVVGQELRIADTRYTIVGVIPRSFRLEVGNTDAWMVFDPTRDRPGFGLVRALALVAPNLSRDNAATLSESLTRRLNSEQPRSGRIGWSMGISFLGDATTMAKQSRVAILLLAGSASLLLLIACANVANLLLARTTDRWREIVTRRVLGATAGRIVAETLAESMVLGVAGGVVGIIVASWGTQLLIAMMPPSLLATMFTTIEMNERVLAFAIAISLLTAIASALIPAIRAAASTDSLLLADRSAMGSVRGRKTRNALVVAELALATVLLAGAALLGNSFVRQISTDVGFDGRNTLIADIEFLPRVPPSERREAVIRMRDRLAALPGVERASVGVAFANDHGMLVGVSPQPESGAPVVVDNDMMPYTSVSPGYFPTVGLRIVEGRDFVAGDAVGEPVAIVDEAFAQKLWPAGQAVGKRFRMTERGAWRTVVGVTAHPFVVGQDMRTPIPYWMYYPIDSTEDFGSVTLAVRTADRTDAMARNVGQAIRSAIPDQPVKALQWLDVRLHASLDRSRFLLTLMAAFAGVALLLAVAGIYGVLSYAVARRTREIGVRMALGATQRIVVNAILGEAMMLSMAGVTVGLLVALGAGRVTSGLLYGVSSTDPLTHLVVAVTLVAAGSAAAFLPAWKASRVQPAVAVAAE